MYQVQAVYQGTPTTFDLALDLHIRGYTSTTRLGDKLFVNWMSTDGTYANYLKEVKRQIDEQALINLGLDLISLL